MVECGCGCRRAGGGRGARLPGERAGQGPASRHRHRPSGCFPPDGDIATSASWMVQTVNDQIVMFNWNTNAYVQKSFATFFGDGTYFLFDPRVLYDRYFVRFIVLADG